MDKSYLLAFLYFHRSMGKIILLHKFGHLTVAFIPLKLFPNHRIWHKESITVLRLLMLIIHLSIVNIPSFLTDSEQLSSALYSTLMYRLVVRRFLVTYFFS